MNALLSFVELPAPAHSRGQKRTLDDSQAPDENTSNPTGVFAALDDWFAGTQYDSTRPSPQSTFGLGIGSAHGQERAAGELGTMVQDPLFAEAFGDGRWPLQDWTRNGSEPYDGQDELSHIFGISS